MDWLKIVSALGLLAMIALIFPRVKEAVAQAPKGSANDWRAALLPLLLVAGFVALLVYVSRGS